MQIKVFYATFLMVALSFMGLAAEEAKLDWKAKWIWQEEDGPANAWVVFRKKVNLQSVPEKVTANISADSKYWLWINGELVVFEGSAARGSSRAKPWNRPQGAWRVWELPPEDKPTNTWYEEVDLSGYLKPGENTIAVLTWFWGRETHKGYHINSGKGGFIFQADLGEDLLISDRTWKVKLDPAYGEDEQRRKGIVQYNVRYDARKEMGKWMSPEFKDEDWKSATEKGLPPTAPWYNLEKNYVPSLVDHGLQDYESHPQTKFPFISDGREIRCRLPFNKQITPYFEIESKKAGMRIEVTTDNIKNIIDTSYTTKKGRQDFESYSWTNGHEVIYKIPKGIKVLGLKYRWMSVGEMAGSFESSDPDFTRLWWMGRNTLFVCSRDNFMDCPDRERALWIGDVADQASYLFYCMDDAGRQLLKKAIRITMAFSHENVYAGLGPLRLRELPSQSLQFAEQGIWQYYLNTGDKETLAYAYPFVRNYLNLWTIGKNGLSVRRKLSQNAWKWTDWGVKGTNDEPVILDALYFMALESAKKMAAALGKSEDVAEYEKRTKDFHAAFNKAYWNGSFYSSNPETFQDDRANCLAILTGLAGKEKYASIVEKVLIPNQFCSPHFEWMVGEALCVAGRHDAALKRMKERYQSQIDRKDLTTLGETFPDQWQADSAGGTYNHAWNAPNTILSKHIAGIAPTKPGWSEFQILPYMESFTHIKHVIPSVKGEITVGLRTQDKTFELELVSPEGTETIIGIPKSIGSITAVKANGKIVWENGNPLNDGQKITAAGEDNDHLKFRVTPGTWSISATAK